MTIGEGVDAGKFWLRSLWPPPVGADDRQIRKWRFAVFYTVVIMTVGTTTFIVWSLSIFALVGLPHGFAYADDAASTNKVLVAIQNGGIKRDIRETKRQQCTAIAERDQSVLNYATETLEDLRDQYRTINGSDPRVPGCEEVLIGSGH